MKAATHPAVAVTLDAMIDRLAEAPFTTSAAERRTGAGLDLAGLLENTPAELRTQRLAQVALGLFDRAVSLRRQLEATPEPDGWPDWPCWQSALVWVLLEGREHGGDPLWSDLAEALDGTDGWAQRIAKGRYDELDSRRDQLAQLLEFAAPTPRSTRQPRGQRWRRAWAAAAAVVLLAGAAVLWSQSSHRAGPESQRSPNDPAELELHAEYAPSASSAAGLGPGAGSRCQPQTLLTALRFEFDAIGLPSLCLPDRLTCTLGEGTRLTIVERPSQDRCEVSIRIEDPAGIGPELESKLRGAIQRAGQRSDRRDGMAPGEQWRAMVAALERGDIVETPFESTALDAALAKPFGLQAEGQKPIRVGRRAGATTRLYLVDPSTLPDAWSSAARSLSNGCAVDGAEAEPAIVCDVAVLRTVRSVARGAVAAAKAGDLKNAPFVVSVDAILAGTAEPAAESLRRQIVSQAEVLAPALGIPTLDSVLDSEPGLRSRMKDVFDKHTAAYGTIPEQWTMALSTWDAWSRGEKVRGERKDRVVELLRKATLSEVDREFLRSLGLEAQTE